MAYFNLDDVLELYPESLTYYIIGRRGSGKSWGAKRELLLHNIATGKQFLFLGRTKDDIDKELLKSFFTDVWRDCGLAEMYAKKYNIKQPALIIKGKASNPTIYIGDTSGDKETIIEPVGYAWSVKDGERFKRGVWHDKIDRVLFDEIITAGQYYKGDNEPVYMDKFIGSLARATNTTLRCYCLGNPDKNPSLCPYLSGLNLNYDKMSDNSIITYDTKDGDGIIHKNNIVLVKVSNTTEEGKAQEFLSGRASGVFSSIESNMALTGQTKRAKYNHATPRDFEGFQPIITIKTETPIKCRGFSKHVYATLGSRKGLTTLFIHSHDSYDGEHILSAYEPLGVEERAVYRLNFAMYPDIANALRRAILGLQVYTDDDNTAQVFFSILDERASNPYFTA